MTMIIMIVQCHVCRNDMEMESANRFTPKGVEQIKKAARERKSAGDMTELELKLSIPVVEPLAATTYIKHATK